MSATNEECQCIIEVRLLTVCATIVPEGYKHYLVSCWTLHPKTRGLKTEICTELTGTAVPPVVAQCVYRKAYYTEETVGNKLTIVVVHDY